MEATEKQVQFIARLVEEREIPPRDRPGCCWRCGISTVLIDTLLALPRLRQDKA